MSAAAQEIVDYVKSKVDVAIAALPLDEQMEVFEAIHTWVLLELEDLEEEDCSPQGPDARRGAPDED